jgi:hypothetical protein
MKFKYRMRKRRKKEKKEREEDNGKYRKVAFVVYAWRGWMVYGWSFDFMKGDC